MSASGRFILVFHLVWVGVVGWAGYGWSIGSDPFPTPPLELRNLPDPEAVLTCYIPVEIWRQHASLRMRDPSPVEDLKERSLPYLDPRAKPFLASDILAKTEAFAMSIWPDMELGGERWPVWLMGFCLDSPETAETGRGFLEREISSDKAAPFERTLSGFTVRTINTVAKDLHLVSAGKVLLVSSNLRVLRSFLEIHAESPLPMPPIEIPATLTWRLESTQTKRPGSLNAMRRFLWNLGVRRVNCACEILEPGYRFRLSFEGEMDLPPMPPPTEFDFSMIDHIPENSDLILLGGSSKGGEIYFSEQFPSLPQISGQGVPEAFAVGIGVPSGTETTTQSARIAGAYRKRPPPIPSDLIPNEVVAASHERPGTTPRVARLGELELALVDREDRMLFRNTLELRPDESIRLHFEALLPLEEMDVPPSYVGVISPNLLARPLDIEWQEFRRQEHSLLLDLWPLLRSLMRPVDLLIFVGRGERVDIELRSHSFFSPILTLLQTANLLRILEQGDLTHLNQWMGSFGALPRDSSVAPTRQ